MGSNEIHYFDNINDFHRMANGGLESQHEDIHIFRFEDVSKDASKRTPLFKTGFFQIGLFKQVEFEVSYFGSPHQVQKSNAVVLFKPGQTISFTKANPEARGLAVMFKDHFIDISLNNVNTLRDFSILEPDRDCVLFLENNDFDDIFSIAVKMQLEYNELHIIKSASLLKIYGLLLLEKINRLSGSNGAVSNFSVEQVTFQNFQSLVFKNIHKTKMVSDYADMLFMTERSLNKHINAVNDLSPKQIINEMLILESKALLQRRIKIDEISDYLNFTDQAHFSNFFRKMTGQTPREFRKSI
jgi:AraC-like DNA-binding protein